MNEAQTNSRFQSTNSMHFGSLTINNPWPKRIVSMKFSEPALNPVAYFLHLKLTNLSVKTRTSDFWRSSRIHPPSHKFPHNFWCSHESPSTSSTKLSKTEVPKSSKTSYSVAHQEITQQRTSRTFRFAFVVVASDRNLAPNNYTSSVDSVRTHLIQLIVPSPK